LEQDLNASRSHAAALESSLRGANAQNAELQASNAELRRKLDEADDDRRRAEERARRLAKQEADNAELRRKLDDADDERRRAEEKARRLARQEADDAARRKELDDEERRRLQRELERQMDEDKDDEDESRTVFVYGLEDCQKTDAVHKALKKAQVPFQKRDFNRDKRFMKAVTKNEDYDGAAIYAPVVTLGGKAWWQKMDDTQLIPFPQAVAMDLRHELGLNKPKPDKVRVGVDIDSEIYERYLTMQEAFLKLDDDKDGFVTEEELKRKCLEWNIPVSEARRAIVEGDRDGNGCLDFDEFAKRFNSVFSRSSRGALRSLAPAPNQFRPRTSPLVACVA